MTDKKKDDQPRKRRTKGSRFVDPQGEPVMLVGVTGKKRMGFRKRGKVNRKSVQGL